MLKVLGLIDRRADFAIADFSAYWRTTHLQEALKLKAFIARYVQNHFWPTPLAGLRRPADGGPELWFHDAGALAAMARSEAYLTGAYLDEQHFMQGRATGIAMRETIIAPEPAHRAVKVVFLHAAATGTDLASFAAAQADHDSPLLTGARRAIGWVRSTALETGAYLGADEVWWATQAEFEADWAERPAPPSFLDPGGCAGCQVDELRMF